MKSESEDQDPGEKDKEDHPNRMKYIPYLVVIVLSSLAYLIGTMKYGIGLSTDSVKYFSAADNIAGGCGFEIYSGDLYYQYSPLTPLFLSVFPLLGIDTLAGARIFFLFVYILNIFLALYIINMVIRNRNIRIIGMIILVFSISIYRVFTMLYSEPLFILLTLASFIFLYKYLRDRRNHQLVLLIIFSALACLSRYIGLVLLITVALIMLAVMKGDLLKKIGIIWVYGIASGLPTLVFVARNHHLTGTFLGERYPSNYGLLDNLRFVSGTITEWFVPDFLNFEIFIVIYFLLIIAALVLIISNLSRVKRILMSNRMLFMMASFSVLYILYLVISASRIGFDTLNNRFLSPVNLPILLSIIIGVDIYFRTGSRTVSRSPDKRNGKRYIGYLMVGLLVMMALSQVTLTGLTTYRKYTYGSGGYNVDDFHDSEILGYLKDNDLDGNIYTNSPESFFLFLEINDASLSPRKTYQASNEYAHELPAFNTSLSNIRDNYIVWFDIVSRSYLYDIDELDQIYNLTMIMEFPDGTIYRIE